MTDTFIQKKQKIEFRDIVLAQVKKILDIGANEMRGGYYKETPAGNFIAKEYVPDNRKCYIQVVEDLAIITYSYFDEQMTKWNEDIEKRLNELIKKFEKEKEKRITNEESYEDLSLQLIKDRLTLSKELFKKLNILLKNKEYLKGATEILDDDDDEDEED